MEDKAIIEEFVGALGQIMYLDEDKFNAFSAFGGRSGFIRRLKV